MINITSSKVTCFVTVHEKTVARRLEELKFILEDVTSEEKSKKTTPLWESWEEELSLLQKVQDTTEIYRLYFWARRPGQAIGKDERVVGWMQENTYYVEEGAPLPTQEWLEENCTKEKLEEAQGIHMANPAYTRWTKFI